MLPIGPSLSKTSSASSPTLWAMPSKEWVIPAKPKPGRKPKKESSSSATTSKDDEDNDSFGRRVQNRAAQRAFRERRQSQLAELQARLHSYEQGEIERNIALQNIAKRMKEENEQLRKENHILKEKVTRLECQLEEAEQDKKRLRDDPTTRSYDAPSAESQRKRARMDEDAQAPPFGARASTGVSPSLDEGIQTTALSLAQDEISPHFPAPAPPVSETLTYAGLDGPSISLDSSDDIDSFHRSLDIDTDILYSQMLW
ncbi:hypothetical protein ID866_1753 [Astraeus odoratus]|nr:hypothetical protein ID866_1753 [Astraeus odoratus]